MQTLLSFHFILEIVNNAPFVAAVSINLWKFTYTLKVKITLINNNVKKVQNFQKSGSTDLLLTCK